MSISKRVDVELVNNQKRIKKALAKPTIKNFTYVTSENIQNCILADSYTRTLHERTLSRMDTQLQ